MKNIYLLVGESGSGKTTIQKMLELSHDLIPLKSYTTRPPRDKNEDNHTFAIAEDLKKLQNIVAYTEFCGNEYCATAEQVETTDTYVIDPAGIDFMKKAYRGEKGIKIIYITSPIHTRIERMQQRGESFSNIMERIVNDAIEFRRIDQKADYIAHNGDDAALNMVAFNIWQFIRKCEGDDDL